MPDFTTHVDSGRRVRRFREDSYLTASFSTWSRRVAAPAIILCCFMATAAVADDPAELEDVIVTAGLEPVLAQDVANSVTVITREQIERRQVRYLSDLLRDVPGFAVSQSGGPGSLTQVRVRGAEANQLLVLIDGIRANDPASGDEFQFQYALTSNIERIEIIRGPQSATWGTDALAGVINIIRRKDLAAQERYISANAQAGSFDTVETSVEGGVRSGSTTFSGGLTYLDTAGTNISRAGFEADGSENLNANARLEIEAMERLSFVLSGQRIDASTEFDGVSFVTGLPEDADQTTDAERTYLSVQARLEPRASRWSGAGSINRLESSNENFLSGSANGSTAAETLEFRLRGSVVLGSEASGDHRLTFALDREENEFSQRGLASDFGNPNQDQSYDVTGYAAEYIGGADPGLSWTLSARHDDFSAFDDATTWQIALSKRFERGVRIRGSLGTGSKAPTFIERFGFYPDFFLGNPGLKPETSRGFEVGLHMPIGPMQVGASYFKQALEDEINGFVFDPETFFFTAANRTGTSDRKGVELVFTGDVGTHLSLQASYTYTDASEVDATGTEVHEPRRPRHMASLNVNYAFASDRGNLNLNINFNGEQFDNYFPPPTFERIGVTLDDFTVVGLSGSWHLNENWEIIGRAANLFDEDYEEILGFARPGRSIYAGIRTRF